MARNLILPALLVAWLVRQPLALSPDDFLRRVVDTTVGFSFVWFFVSILKTIFLAEAHAHTIRGRTPKLLIDIVRIVFVSIGMVIVYSSVWHKDVSPLLTTFGVGSLVLGLALQDTLGNLFAGLALVLERPIAVGDWIQLGEVVGRVQQINWRSVRIVTRELNEITIPNSAIGKERIMNFSSPSRLHGFKLNFGFSYDAPPNTVKEMLYNAAIGTPGILASPAPDVRTSEFAAYAIQYELRVFIANYDDIVSVRNNLMTRIWYAARRCGIAIPYPISMLYKTEVPYQPSATIEASRIRHVLRSTELLSSISEQEAQLLTDDLQLERYATDEVLVREGDVGHCFFVILEGTCSIKVAAKHGGLIPVTTIGVGALVGEMSLLAGTARTATVTATSDVVAARIGRSALSKLLAARRDLLEIFAHYAAEHAREIEAARLLDSQSTHSAPSSMDEKALGDRIRRFFGLA
jgi:small-conductance mechanosensitive channel/CRP-like cAMP-binding protein